MLTADLYAILTFNVRICILKVENTRIRKTHGEEETTFVYNTNARLSQLLVEKKGDTITKYVYGHGLICSYTGDETTLKVYHHDYRGSKVAITNILAETTDTFDYDIYGKLISRTGTTQTPFMYNGRHGVYSDENGLIYMRARYYSPELRRFVNADILHGDITDSTSLNRYAYVNGNPVSLVDPLGMMSIWSKIAIGVGAVVVGAAVVAATVATAGAAAAFVGTVATGLKAAAISGAVSAVVGAGKSAANHRNSTGSWDGVEEAVLEGAVEGFGNGFMWGGITSGVGMAAGSMLKKLPGVQIGQTQKPQYGKVNIGYGTPNANGMSIASFQNNLGKRVFGLDIDIVNGIHMHLPYILPDEHIPIGSIVTGIIAGENTKTDSECKRKK